MLVATACASSEPSGSAKPQEDAFGYGLAINAYQLGDADLERALDLAEEAGVTSISTGAVWWHIAPEPSPGSYNWEGLDRLVVETTRRDLRLNVQITGTPDWAHPWLVQRVQDPVRRRWHPPRGEEGLRHFEGFVRTLVERYGTRVDRYEIWNEPNLKLYWEPRPDPGEYAALLRVAYTTIKDAEPEATVVSGGLARNHMGFLEGYYRAARGYPDAKESDYFFDVLGLHTYTRGPDGTAHSPDWSGADRVIQSEYGPLDYSFTGMAQMKRIMEQNGDRDKSIFIGEFGYSTVDIETFGLKGIPDPKRALYLKRAYALARDLPYVEEMVWYAYLPAADNTGWSIVDSDLNPSLTFRALKQASGSGRVRRVTVEASEKPVVGTTPLEVGLTGDGGEIASWELYVDGYLAASHEEAPTTWDARGVADGEHELLVAAYARNGSVWASNPLKVTVSNKVEETS